MRILITNDDGINAPGLAVAHEIASDLAGPEGEVWIVAPAFEQSGVAHCISYASPTAVARLDERRYAAEGSPADCVLAALHDVMTDGPPDLVISGVNRGNNAGENAMYSGTVGGAMEAALQGLPAVALSQYLGPRIYRAADPFASARAHGAALIRQLLKDGDWTRNGSFRLFYNINFPPLPAEETLAPRVGRQGQRNGPGFGMEPFVAPNGRRFLWVRVGPQDVGATADSDVDLCLRGHIAITPMRADLTCHAAIAPLQKALER